MRVVQGHVEIGPLTASTTPSREARQLLSLVGELGMGGAGGRCVVELAGPSLSPPAQGDLVRVSLGDEQGLTPIFTGQVLGSTRTVTALRISAVDGLAKLARLDVEGHYENQTAGAIVRDVLGQAGVEEGTISDGPTLGSYTLHRGPRALRHLQRLAELRGADLYTDGEGRACFTTPAEEGTRHTFRYGGDVLQFHLESVQPAFDSIIVRGEGAADAQGSDKAHWLMTDLESVSGKAALGESGAVTAGQEGERPLLVVEGAVRSGEAARVLAEARMAAVASRAVRGFLEVLGTPGVTPGDSVLLEDLPGEDTAAPALRVRRVRHRLDPHHGFLTRMDF
jgi:hypothetical protein